MLTVSVSVAGGVLAITSAIPGLAGWNVRLCVLAIVLITFVNLRGVRESGIAFALPTYGFIVAMLVLIGVGLVECLDGSPPHAVAPNPLPAGTGAVTIFVLLRAFASGSSALTGVEAIANGVNAFKKPQAANAAKTLLLMASAAIVLFLGVSYLAVQMDARPSSSVSVLSEIANATFPAGSAAHFMFWVVQVFTFGILVLAANTSYQGFPRLAAIMARDGFFPRQFSNLGDRLVFSNGVLVLAAIATALILVFGADVNSLIHLYVLGVFTAFTLSQAGMVKHWFRTRAPRWKISALINGIGAARDRPRRRDRDRHEVHGGRLGGRGRDPASSSSSSRPRAATTTSSAGGCAGARRPSSRSRCGTGPCCSTSSGSIAATRTALWYAQTIAKDDLRADSRPVRRLGSRHQARASSGSPTASRTSRCCRRRTDAIDAVLDYIWELPHGESDFVSVVIPELFRRPSLLAAFLRRTTFSLKLRLLPEPGIVITDVPRVLDDDPESAEPHARDVRRSRLRRQRASRCAPFVTPRRSGSATRRALPLVRRGRTRPRMREDWLRNGTGMPLQVAQATHRDLGEPLLAYLRAITADPEAMAVVVMPELVVRGVDRLLHNQRALYLKRLLLFEPRVILTSVPYQLL